MASEESSSRDQPGGSSEQLTWKERQRLREKLKTTFGLAGQWGPDSSYDDGEMQAFLRANSQAKSLFDFELASQLVKNGASLETIQMIIDSSPEAFTWVGHGWASVLPACSNLLTVACYCFRGRETLEIIKYFIAKFPSFPEVEGYAGPANYVDDDGLLSDHLIMHNLATYSSIYSKDETDCTFRLEAMEIIHAHMPNAISCLHPDSGSPPLYRLLLTRDDRTDIVVWMLETYPEAASIHDEVGYLPLVLGLRFVPAYLRRKCFQKLFEANPSALSEVMRTQIAGKTFDATALHFLLTLGAPDGKGSYSQRTNSRLQTFGRLELVQWVLEADLSALSIPMVLCGRGSNDTLISPTSCMALAKASACDHDDCSCARCNIYRTIQIVENAVGSNKSLEEIPHGWDEFGSGDLQWAGGRKILFDACPAVIAAYLYRDGNPPVMPTLISYAGRDDGPGLGAVYDLVRSNADLME